MKPSLLVLANFSEAAEKTARVAAALGSPLQLPLVLLHLNMLPAILEPELVAAAAKQLARDEAEIVASLQTLARRLPVPAEVAEAAGVMTDAVAAAVEQYHPLLLAMGVSPEHDLLDYLVHNQLLPVLRATQQPLLLVPEACNPVVNAPSRVLIAIDAEPFNLNEAARNLSSLLAAWQATYTVTHVATEREQRISSDRVALAHVRTSGLLPPDVPLELYQESHTSPAAGICQAVADTQADLLVMIARPRSFLGRLFHRSVTAQVLRQSRVPVLLMPAISPSLPGWMSGLS
jgi:nucleotide-binding universal stress UspA family protein